MFAAPNTQELDVEASRGPQASAPYQQTIDTKTSGIPLMQPQQSAYGQQYGGQPGGVPPQNGGMQQTQQSGGQTGGKQSTIIRLANSLEWGTQMFLIAFFSMLEFIVAAQICNSNIASGTGDCLNTWGYQVAVGVISFAFAMFFWLVHYAGRIEDARVQSVISVFFLLWWTAGVIILTFIGTFTTTIHANGYFGAWGAFIMSLFSLVAVSAVFESSVNRQMHSVRKPIFFVVIASAVVMGASIAPCSPNSACTSYNAYAVVVSVVSLGVALILLCLPQSVEKALMKVVGMFFVIWWIFGASVLTLGGPFLTTGNGYFGSFAALLASVAMVRTLSYEPQAPDQ